MNVSHGSATLSGRDWIGRWVVASHQKSAAGLETCASIKVSKTRIGAFGEIPVALVGF
jgi:hypothetical protein